MPEFTQYRTIDGDRADLLAWDFYGDPYRYQPIYEANPAYHGIGVFDAGIILQIPVLEDQIEAPAVGLPPWRR